MKSKMLSWILIFSLMFQPFVFEVACWAEGESPSTSGVGTTAEEQAKKAEEAQKQFDEAHNKLMETPEIKKPNFLTSAVLWLSGKKKEIERQIKAANEELKKAKEEMTKIKKEIDEAKKNVDEAVITNAQAIAAQQLERAAQVKQQVADAMKKVGEIMQKVGESIKKVSDAIVKNAEKIGGIPVIGKLVKLGLIGVAKFLSKASSVVIATGKNLVEFAANASISVQDFVKIAKDGAEAWKQTGKEQAGGAGEAPSTQAGASVDSPSPDPATVVTGTEPDESKVAKDGKGGEKGTNDPKTPKKKVRPSEEGPPKGPQTDGHGSTPEEKPEVSAPAPKPAEVKNPRDFEERLESIKKEGIQSGNLAYNKGGHLKISTPFVFTKSDKYPYQIQVGGQEIFLSDQVTADLVNKSIVGGLSDAKISIETQSPKGK